MQQRQQLTLPNLLRNTAVLLVGVLAATYLMDSIHADSTATLVSVALVLTLLNLVVKPLLILFTLPFVVLSMGLGLFVINALLLMLAGRLIDGFHVDGFLAALIASLLISALSLIVNMIFGPRPKVNFNVSIKTGSSARRSRRQQIDRKDDAIDV
jgi:putative membrane protein